MEKNSRWYQLDFRQMSIYESNRLLTTSESICGILGQNQVSPSIPDQARLRDPRNRSYSYCSSTGSHTQSESHPPPLTGQHRKERIGERLVVERHPIVDPGESDVVGE